MRHSETPSSAGGPPRRRRVAGVAVTAATALTLVLAACGANSEGGDPESAELDWFMWSGSQSEVKAWEHLAEMVTEKYPDIKVNLQTTTFADYFTKLNTLAAGDELPCLISTQAQRVSDVGELFTPLDDRLTASTDPSNFDPSIMEALSYDDEYIALPYDIAPYVVFYNKDAFAKAGLKEPAIGWTFDEFKAAATKLTGDGKYGFSVTGYPDQWLQFAVSGGASYLTDDGELDLTNSELAPAFDEIAQLAYEDNVAQKIPATPDQDYPFQQWESGKVAMVVSGPFNYINAISSAPFEFGVAPIPEVDGTSASLITGSGFGISSSCPNKDAAFNALEVLTSPEAEQYLAKQGRALPARPAERDAWYQQAKESGADARRPIEAALKTAEPYITTSTWDQVSSLLFQYGTEVINGNESAESVLESVQDQVNAGS